jgi:oligosaccharide repeat unit polymerase
LKIRILANPNILFIGVWTSVIYLQSLHVLNIYLDADKYNISFIYTNIIFALLIVIYQAVGNNRRYNYFAITKKYLEEHHDIIDSYIRKLLIIYVGISIVDVIYSGGIPILWPFMGIIKDHTEYGTPTLHGLANGIVFFTTTLMFLLIMVENKKKYWYYIALMLVWQFMILSRGVIMVSLAQLLCIYFIFTKQIKIRWLSTSIIILIIGFGYLGDLRQGSNPYYGLLDEKWIDSFEKIPSGFLWVYVYFTSGFNNVIYNTTLIDPNYFPYFSFAKLLPSIAYSLLGISKAVDSYEFVNTGLNVSSIYSGFYSDFGYLAFIPVSIIQIFSFKFYKGAIRGNLTDILSYTVFFQAILLSFFIDTLLYLPFVVQFYFIYKLKKLCLKKLAGATPPPIS